MNIAFFNCQMRSVPPKKSGGIEKMMNYLIDELTDRGHHITLYAPADSPARHNLEIVSKYPTEIEMLDIDSELKNEMNDQRTIELGEMLLERQHTYDIIINFCLESALPVIGKISAPLVSRISEELNEDAVERLHAYRKSNFISISMSQRETAPSLNYVANIYNAVDANAYAFTNTPQNFLVFAGRISQQKAPHLAIEAARKLGMKLYLLGRYKDEHIESEYYSNVFLPALNANKQYAEWVGEVDDKTLNWYFDHATASLFPVSFREPFGNAAVESMACGCPPITFNRGAYSETIVQGETGYVVNDVDEMVTAVKKIDLIDRNACRAHVQKNFSVKTMADNYLQTCYKVIENHAAREHRIPNFLSNLLNYTFNFSFHGKPRA
jgi:glycosyltransferase involved in cell wall biosynthesis